ALGETSYALDSFVEKPDLDTAQAYLESGNYLWNAGMFLFRAGAYLQELERVRPEMVAHCREAMDGALADLDFIRPESRAFLACPADSIDYAVMEHTRNGAVVALDCGWSDVGAWSALWEVADRDSHG